MSLRDQPFLTAEWRHLAMLNYHVDPSLLHSLVPAGTELDDWRGNYYASLVGFLFLKTRVCGIGIPFHRDFEEVNLRFYVRRKAGHEWRRGVVFVKEIVPRFAIALTARAAYGERYVSARMAHQHTPGPNGEPRNVSYSWWLRGRETKMSLAAEGAPAVTDPGREAEFITEHYWGYVQHRDGKTTEYQVHHPRWRVRAATTARVEGDVIGTYGPAWATILQAPPASACLVEGSAVDVSWGSLL